MNTQEEETVKGWLSRISPEDITEEAIQSLLSILLPIAAVKGQKVLEQGQISRHIYFVKEGLLRSYYFKNGHDVTDRFTQEGQFCLSAFSLFLRKPSELSIEVLESGTLYALPYQELLELSKRHHIIHQFYCTILENGELFLQDQYDMLKNETAQQSLSHFSGLYPDIIHRAPLMHIASYLTMSPETLSRIMSHHK